MKRTHNVREYRDFQKRQMCARSLIFRTALKYLTIQTAVSSFVYFKHSELQNVLQSITQTLQKNARPSFLKNFCVKTGQAVSINRFTRLNRMQAKKLIEAGLLNGARHSR